MDKRKFYKTILTFEVLSEEDILGHSLGYILGECENGRFVGRLGECSDAPLNGAEMASALNEFGSEPSFFELTPEGNAGCDECGINDRAEGETSCGDCLDEVRRRDEKNGLYGEK